MPGIFSFKTKTMVLVAILSLGPLIGALPVSNTLAPGARDDGADIIFFNGQIVTLGAETSPVQALAVRDNKILAIGSNREILPLRTPKTLVINLKGLAVLPGFIDGHTHVLRFPDRQGKTLDDAITLALSQGLTTVNELAADQAFLDRLFEAEQQGRLRLRVNVYPEYNAGILDSNGKTIIERVWFPPQGPILDLNRKLRIPGIKIFVDGAFTPGRGCPALSEPYQEEFQATADFKSICFSERGDLYLTQDEMNPVVAEAQAAGYRVAFHAMGERAIDIALNAVESALQGQPNERYRHQIHHNSILRPDQLSRYTSLNLLASVRGYFNTCEQDSYPFWFGPNRFEWAANRYSLPNLGIHAFAEGDFGWTTDPSDVTSRPINPLLTLYGLVTHKQLRADGSACEPAPWIAQHTISTERALQMLTIEAAYAASQETVIGSLVPGKFADLVILSANPLVIGPDSIKDIKVLATMVNGRLEYCASGFEAFCSPARNQATIKQWPVPFTPHDVVVAPDGTIFMSSGPNPPLLLARLNPGTNQLTTYDTFGFHLAIGPAIEVKFRDTIYREDFTVALAWIFGNTNKVRLLLPTSDVILEWTIPGTVLDIASSSTHLWTTIFSGNDRTELASLDPKTSVLTRYDLDDSVAGTGGYLHGLSFGGGKVWYGVVAGTVVDGVETFQQGVGSLDPSTATATVWTLFTVPPGEDPGIGRVATFGSHASWTFYHTASQSLTGLYRLDPTSNKLQFYSAPLGAPSSPTVDRAKMVAGAAWTTTTSREDSALVARIIKWQPLAFGTESNVTPTSPAVTASTETLTRTASLVSLTTTVVSSVTFTTTGIFAGPDVTIWSIQNRRHTTHFNANQDGKIYFGLAVPASNDMFISQLTTR